VVRALPFFVPTKAKEEMWTVPNGPPVSTIFFQGLLMSQISAAQYVGEYRAATGELVRWANALPMLWNVFAGEELAEVDLESNWSWQALANWLWIRHAGYTFLSAPIGAPTMQWHATRLRDSNLGQTEDMIQHARKVAAAPAADLVLFGYSRGAKATFCAMAHYKYPRVRLVVLESIFYSVEDLECRFGLSEGYKLSALRNVLAPRFETSGPSPGSLVKEFPQVPIAIISAKHDPLVKIGSQRRLAWELANSGHEVYHLVLNTDEHRCVVSPNETDRRNYLIFLHALYRKLNLPHIAPLAEEGALLLETTKL